MYHKQLLKNLLVVLALALWASAAYGTTFTAGALSTGGLTYTLGLGNAQPGVSATFSVSDNGAGPDSFTLSPSTGLIATCAGAAGGISTVSTGNPVLCTVSINSTGATSLGVGSPVLTVDIIPSPAGGSADTSVTVPVTVTAAPTLTPITAQTLSTYYLGTANMTGLTLTPRASADGSPWTAVADVSQSWLTVTGSGTANILTSGGTALVFTVHASAADTLTAGPANNSTTVTITMAGVATVVTVTLPVVLPTLTISPTATLSPYQLQAGGSLSGTSNLNASVSGVNYQVAVASTGNWLGASSGSVGTTPTAYTFTVNTTNANGLTPSDTANTGTVTFSIAGHQILIVTVTLPVTAAAVTLSAGTFSSTLTYRLYSDITPQTPPFVTSAITASDSNTATAYVPTKDAGCPNWVTLGTTGLLSGSNLTINVDETLADAAGAAASGTCTITLTYSNLIGSTPTTQTTTKTLNYSLTAAARVTAPNNLTINYTVHAGGSITTTSIPTSNINNTAYTVASNQTWLVPSGTAPLTAKTDNTGSTVTFTVLPATADQLTVGNNVATVTLTPTLGNVLAATTFTVTLSLTAGPSTLTTPLAVNFQHVAAAPTPAPQTTLLTDSVIGDASYSVSITSGTWLTVTSANGGGSVSGTGTLVSGSDQLTYTVDLSQTTSATVGSPLTATVILTAPNELPKNVTVKYYLVNATTLSAAPNAVSFATNYAKGTGSGGAPVAVPITISDSAGSTDHYMVGAITATTQWLACTPTNNAIGNGVSDQLMCSVITAVADTTPAGPQTATVHVTLTNALDATFTVTLTITTAVPPLTVTQNPAVSLSYLVGGGPQSSVTTGVASTIQSVNSVYQPYSTNIPTLPAWLTATPVNYRSDTTHTDSIVFKVVPQNVPAGSGVTKFTVHLAITGNPNEPDRTIVVTLNTTISQLSSTGQSQPLSYIKGSGGTPVLYNNIKLTATGTVAFTLNAATVPPWATATTTQGGSTPYTGGNASSGGATVYFNVVTATAANMATGNYTANIGFSTTGYADLLVPITLLVSNGAATLNLQETNALQSNVWGLGTPVPIPTWTPYSSNEPIPFSATCSVVASDTNWVANAAWRTAGNVSPCSLNAAASVVAGLPVSKIVTGVAFTTGFTIAASLDPGLFASTLGNTVSVTVQILQTSGGSGSISKTYTYSLQPVNPKVTSISPASAALIPESTSMVVLVTGTNFIGPQNISPNATNLEPTQVWLGNSTTPLASGVVVVNTTQLQVTIPHNAFTTYAPIPAGQTSAKLVIGIANQTGTVAPTAPTATGNLIITTAPVIYGVTSTATYVQPSVLGGNPSFAPYELISIFGDNFGLSNLTPNYVNAAPNAYGLFPTALTLSGTAAAKNLVALSVTFKDAATGKASFSAPILFANQNQINAAVPAGLVASAITASTYNMTVTSGAATNVSTPFAVNVVPADPGIFTLASDGSGPGAIVNVKDGTINKVGNEATATEYVSIYLTGLGSPQSAAIDTTGNGVSAPLNCVAISGTKAAPGYLQVVNTSVKASATTTAYTAPTPAWTSIDGAVISYGPNSIISGLPPCMTDTITVTFGSGATAVTATTLPNGGITYAGFVSGSIAGLYQINVKIPASIPGIPGAVPITVTIPPYTSPAGTATIAIK